MVIVSQTDNPTLRRKLSGSDTPWLLGMSVDKGFDSLSGRVIELVGVFVLWWLCWGITKAIREGR